MHKLKIFITFLALYEFVMLTILQISDYCMTIFNNNFCAMGDFKYFLLCIMLPSLFGLFVWWIPEMVRLVCPNRCAVKQDSEIKSIFSEIISKQDIERFITAAVIMGIQKFVVSHPKTTEVFDDVLKVLKNAKDKKAKH